MLDVIQSTDRNFPEQKAYQQALSDFGLEDLLETISNYSDEDFEAGLMKLKPGEVETLAALLIQHWSNSLNGKLLGGYLNAIRHGNSELLPNSINQEIKFPDSGLPNNFPNVKNPHFCEGQKVGWKSSTNNDDWGIILGHFYAYAPHLCSWTWKYVVWLNHTSPSAAWVSADTAWEEDLVEEK